MPLRRPAADKTAPGGGSIGVATKERVYTTTACQRCKRKRAKVSGKEQRGPTPSLSSTRSALNLASATERNLPARDVSSRC
jgi:hypothetical protein